MPTQEEINAANVELQIANDNYATMANKYNKYQQAFSAYANATPEQQQRASGAMKRLLNDYNQLRLDMFAAEDRIQQAQNRVNSFNETINNQPVQQPTYRQPRRVAPQNNNPQPVVGINPVFDRLNNQNSVDYNRAYTYGATPRIITTNEGLAGSISSATPAEISRVRQLRGNDYLQGMRDLEKYWGYTVVGQNAYKNGQSYKL